MSQPLALSPIDSVFTGKGAYPLEFVFAYAATIDAERLESSLRRVLGSFPAVSSRLAVRNGRYVLEPASDGCPLEVAGSRASFADASSKAGFVSGVETLEGEPLARLRLTQTPGGSVLGVALSHALADGFSYFHFLASWSRVFRGQPFLPPAHERARLAPPEGAAAHVDVEAVRRASGLFLDEPRPAARRDRLSWSRRVFPTAELRALHAAAQREVATRLSHADVVAAWLWREHGPAWTAPGEPLAWLSCPVDVRRLLPGFPASYFGCAVALACASVERSRLAEEPLSSLALRVRAAVASVDASVVERALATIDAVRDRLGLAALERLHVVHPRAGLLVTNLSRLPVGDVVFDAGPPVAFDVLVPAERCAVVLPAPDGLDVRVCPPASPGVAAGAGSAARA